MYLSVLWHFSKSILLIRLPVIASINTTQIMKSTVAPPQDSFCNVILLALKNFHNESHYISIELVSIPGLTVFV